MEDAGPGRRSGIGSGCCILELMGRVIQDGARYSGRAGLGWLEPGVVVDEHGRVEFDDERAKMSAEGAWQCDLPFEGNALNIQTSERRGCDNRAAALAGESVFQALEVHRIRRENPEQQRRVMLSAGGSGAGAEWVAVPR